MLNTDNKLPIDDYEIVVGLELHIQLLTKSKAFSADPNGYGESPNTNVSVITLGHPGTLPVINRQQIDYAILLGLATNCEITEANYFSRKNYFYADLPKGYQITQFDTPICTNGHVHIETDGTSKRIGITRIHMEEDAGKSIHDLDPYHTLIDLNRAGVPLLEIVSEPDLRNAQEAYEYVTKLRKLVRYLGICDGNMEEGSLRCDANISVMKKGSKTFGERTEVKNMNSIRNVKRAIEYEAQRQIAELESGRQIFMETRSFNAADGTTTVMRSKEEAHDYRYFTEPDLPPLYITTADQQRIKEEMPPLPEELFQKYTTELKLSAYDARILTDDKETVLYFEELIQLTNSYKTAANWLITHVKGFLNENAITLDAFPLKPAQLIRLIALVESGKVSHSAAAQQLFPALIESPEKDPALLAVEMNLVQESDEDTLLPMIEAVVAKYPDKVAAYREGNKSLLGLFMGEVMRNSKGKADPRKANELLRSVLEK